MARFTDEKKWSDKWFRSLSTSEKLVWIYLCDNCDIAGFYELDYGYIAFHTGLSELEVTGAIQGLTRGYLEANGYIWLKNFLKHQKNHILNPENNCHKGIIKRIEEKLNLFPTIPKELGAKQPLFRGIGKGKGKGSSKSKGKEETCLTFDLFYDMYDKKVSMQKAKDLFNKTSEEDRQYILSKLNAYVLSTPDKQYRKAPDVWLRNKCWFDEIIVSTDTKKDTSYNVESF